MKRIGVAIAAAIVIVLVCGVAVLRGQGAAGPEAKAEKPVVSCDKILETYKVNQSVDETADALEVDQSRVAACLKGAGIKVPNENDR